MADLLKRFASFAEPPASANYDAMSSGGWTTTATFTIAMRSEAFRATPVPLNIHLTLDQLRGDDVVCLNEQQFADWWSVSNE